MTLDQTLLFSILFVVFALLIWGRWRYDIVAFGALVTAVIVGVVPGSDAYAGFGHPAVVIIALVLIVSRGLLNSGAIDLLAKHIVDANRSVGAHISIFSSLAAGLSAIMNNVGALALLMPLDLKAAKSAKRSPALTLMPLSFASILGGMVTLIGTPPNIVISGYRQTTLGEPYAMFDFAPVGLVCTLVGLAFVATIGWRLVPAARSDNNSGEDLFNLKDFVVEIQVTDDSPLIKKMVREADDLADEHDVAVLGLVRRGHRLPGGARNALIEAGDWLVIEAQSEAIDQYVAAFKLAYIDDREPGAIFKRSDMQIAEVVVPESSMIDGRSASSLGLLRDHNINLLGISREGTRIRQRVRRSTVKAGDVLLLMGPGERLPELIRWLGVLPLAERGLSIAQRDKAYLTVGVFAAAIIAAATGLLYLPIALAVVALFTVFSGLIQPRQIYNTIEWPVIVLLASMIPIGTALEQTGGTALIVSGILEITAGLGPVWVLAILMIVTMSLSDVMNNTATAVIAAPIAFELANGLNVNPDAFLMTVAVAASCAFLTPIGHKNNTLILGPGGYRFGDYWRMGLPLEIIIVAVSIPTILLVWPL